MSTHKSVVIATHYLNYGAAHALRDYLLLNNQREVLFLALPFYTQENTLVEHYKSSQKVSERTTTRKKTSSLQNYFLDIYEVIAIILRQRKRFDTYVGVDNLNCLTGLLLKKIKKVNKVIYYSIDFVPIRFPNKIMNSIYHTVEVFCVKHADEVWNVSPRIAEGREEFLKVSRKKFTQKVVPIGVWNNKVVKTPTQNINPHQLLFLGHLLEKQGVHKVIEAIPDIIKIIPDFSFLIIGDGAFAPKLKKLVSKLDVTKYVKFTGWITDRKKLDKIIGKSACAVAVYKPEKEKLYNFTYYADPTKIKDYLSAGLPVIVTEVPYNAYELQKRKCGIVVQYEKNKIANAIISLLQNDVKRKEFRDNALMYAQEFDWNKIFSRISL